MSKMKVLAKVNDIEITEMDVNGLLQTIDPQRAQQFQTPEGQKVLINELINQNLFLLDAKENEIDKDDMFTKQLEKLRANILSQYAIQKTLSSVKINDIEVKKYYDDNMDSFKEQDSIQASHILMDDEVTANKILKEMNEGLKFEDAANKYSKCSSEQNGGDLGYFTRGKMVQEFEDVAFSLKDNEISKPVKTQFGYHIIKVTGRKAEALKEFGEMKPTIEKQLLSMKQNDLYLNTCKSLKEKYDVKIFD